MSYESIEKEIRLGMNLVDRTEFNDTILAISHIAASTVQKTLGPYAHTTIIDDGNFSYPTKDGWAVLSRLRFQDPTHNSIYVMLKNISARIVDRVGDGTTTAMVVADHFMEGMTKTFGGNNDYRQKDVVDTLNTLKDSIIEKLNENAIQIVPDPNEENPDYQAIYDVAYTSSNGNTQLAEIIQQIYQQTHNPNIMVDMEGGSGLSYEIQTGYRLDCEHLMHDRYINTVEKYYSSNHKPHLFAMFDHSVNYQKDGELIQCIMDYADRQGMVPVFLAPFYDDIVSSQFAIRVQTFAKQHPGYTPNVLVIQIPDMSTRLQKLYTNDFAALAGVPMTNATKSKIFMELRHNERVTDPSNMIHDSAMDIDDYNFTTAQELMVSCCAVVSDFTVGKNFINLNTINTDSVLYHERMEEAKREYEAATEEMKRSTTSLVKSYLEASQRLMKLTGGLGVIHVGGGTDLERQCLRDSVDDTFRACRSAYENGVVPGLNMGPLTILQAMQEDDGMDQNELIKITINLLYTAYKATSKDVLMNKSPEHWWQYYSYETNGNTVLQDDDLIEYIAKDIRQGLITGYDIVTESVDTRPIPTIVNSVATDVEILNAIIGILGMILTSDQYLSVNRMYDKTAAIRQQEALNEISTRNKVDTILSAIDKYHDSHPTSIIESLLQGASNLLSIHERGDDTIAVYTGKSYRDLTSQGYSDYILQPDELTGTQLLTGEEK